MNGYSKAQDNTLSFATNADFVSLDYGFGYFGTSDFTVEIWFKTSTAAYMPIIQKSITGGACQHQNFWAISILATGKLRFEVDENNSGLNYGVIESPLSYNNNQWHHVACTRSGTAIKLFVDGAQVASTNTAGVTNLIPNGAAEIGRGYCGHFNGNIDELKVWNYARSASEINESFAVPSIYPQTGLVNYLDFNTGIAGGNNTGQMYITDKIAPFTTYYLFFFTLNGAGSNYVSSTRTVITNIEGSLGGDFTATGQNLIIQGSNLTGATAASIKVAGVPVYEIASNTGTTISAKSYTASSGKVTVSTPTGGIASSSTNFTFIPVAQQNALHFDGTNDFINMTPYAGLFYTNDFTVEAWFQTSANGVNMPIISKRSACGVTNFWNITITNGLVVWEQYQTSGINQLSLTSTQTYNNGLWHHVAVTRSGTSVKMYIDGVFQVGGNSAAVTNLNDSTTNVQIGHSPCGYYSGRVDEVRIWNEARTASQISSSYKLPVNLPQPTLRSYLGFNQGIPHGNNPGFNTITDINGLVYSLNNFALNGTISNYVYNNVVPIPFINYLNSSALCENTPLEIVGSNLSNIVAEQVSIGGVPIASVVPNASPFTVMANPSSGPVLITTISGSSLSHQVVTVDHTPILSNVNASLSTICSGQSTTLNCTADIPSTIVWEPGGLNGSTVSVSPTSSTTYTITATSIASGCSSTSTLSIVVNPSPTPFSINTNLSELCIGQSTLLKVSLCDTFLNFTNQYAIGNWTTSYTPSNVGGSVNTTNAPSTISITSGDNGVGGSVFYDIPIQTSGTLSFDWAYNTLDGAWFDYPLISLNANSPAFLNGYSVYNTSYSQAGSHSLVVTAGDVLHWIAHTTDGYGSPCTTTYSNLKFIESCSNAAATFTWSPGLLQGTTQTVSPTASTVYTVTATIATGCSFSTTTLINVHPIPNAGNIQTTPTSICAGENATLQLSFATENFTNDFDVSHWTLTNSPGSNGSVNTTNAPASVDIIYPDNNGVGATTSYSVIAPAAGVVSFTWHHTTNNPYIMSTVYPNYSLNTNNASIFNGFNQYGSGDQTGTQSITVNTGDVLNLIAYNAYGDPSGEAKTTISNFQFVPTNSNTVVWNPGSMAGMVFNVTPLATTTYTANITSSYGCQTTTSSTIHVNALPANVVTASSSLVCAGSSVNLSCNSVSTISSDMSSSITIVDNAPANPFPSTIQIASLSPSGSVLKKVYLNGLTHTFPADLDIWLQSPNGQIVMLMSDAGATTLINKNLIFSDDAIGSVPNGFINGVMYKPTNYLVNGTNEPLNPSLQLSSFTGNLNGIWSLFVRDDGNLDTGSIASVQLEFESTLANCVWTANPSTALSGINNTQSLVTSAEVNQQTQYTATVTDAIGCSKTAAVTIEVKPTPEITAVNASPTAICTGASSELSITSTLAGTCPPVLNFTGDFDITHWTTTNSPGSNGSVNTTNAPSSIALIYPNNNSVSSTTIYSITIPESGVLTFNWEHNTITPSNMPVVYPNISINNNPAAIFNGFNQYGSTTQSGTQSVTVATGDVLNLIAFNAYGIYSGNATTTISNLHFTPATCANAVTWNPGAINNATSFVTPLASTTYTATVTSANGCTATATQIVNVNPLPNVTVSSSVASLCPTATNALHFDADNDYISQPTAIDPSSGTWEAWISKENWADHHDDRLVGNGYYYESSNAFYISLHPAVGFHFRYGGTLEPDNVYTSSGNTFGFAPNSWHHLAATWEHVAGTTTIALYIDGVQVSSTTTPLVLSLSAPTFIGGDANFPKFGPGMMEEVRLWNVARTGSEIASNFQNNTPYPQSGLYSLLNFDQSSAGGNNTALNSITDLATPAIVSTLTNFNLTGSTSNYVAATKQLNPTLTLTGNGAATYSWTNGIVDGVAFLPTTNATYTVIGTDVNGCTSSSNVSITLCTVTLNLKALLQGFYLGNSTMQPVLMNQGMSNPATDADSITIELHEAIAPYSLVHAAQSILSTNGIATFDFPATVQGGLYYLVLNHRNSLQTWSASPVLISTNTTYDFSTAASQAFGDNLIEVEPNIFAIYTGDINQDLSIDAFDYILMDPDIVDGNSGYLSTDLNGDGSVDVFDFLLLDPNVVNGVSAATP